MNKIRTYQHLLDEEERLKAKLRLQEMVIRQDLMACKENLEPVKKVYTQVHKIFTRDNRVPVFNIGLDIGIDILLRRFLLRKAGWFVRIFVPYIMKNYASHFIAEEKRKAIIKKIEELFNKIRPKRAAQTKPY